MAPATSPSGSSSPMSSSQTLDNMTKSTIEPAKSASKRKGTRSVSTLTPAQLARKRANDREAQRAIRARTKEHIENLERELEELRGAQNRDETVQELIRKNRILEDELRRLKEGMGISSNGPRSFYPPSFHNPTARPSAPGQGATEYHGIDMGSYDSLSGSGDGWPSAIPRAISSNVSSPSSSGATDDLGSAYFPTSAPSILDRPTLSSTMNSPTVSCISGNTGSRLPTAWHPAHPTNLPAVATMESVPYVLSGVSSTMNASGSTSYWDTPVLATPPPTQTDTLLAGYLQNCRRLVNTKHNSSRPETITGSTCPNIRRLVDAHIHQLSFAQQSPLPPAPPVHPFVELANTVFNSDSISRPLERIGNFVLFQKLVTWFIHPSQETEFQLPTYILPRAAQQNISHDQWIDFLLWPDLRDVVIQQQQMYSTTEFRLLYKASLRVSNWAGGLSQALVPDHSTGAIYIGSIFVNHVLDIGNWALEESFFRRYPELKGLVPLAREGS
ncbi:hypothetical protein BX600DRAFT_509706 [Xylariales sp. PMI_506]|nr:hypothetical protein BX600DRAFT_509706 [Xylariales sp. PMI_506]